MKKKYFAYIRVSRQKQADGGSSLDEQRSAIVAYAERNGLTVVEWFEEVQTATKRGRSTFAKILAGLEAGKADGLIVHKIDRSARNLRDWADLGDLIDRGADVRFVTDNLDLTSRGGRLSADIQAIVAADYVRNLKDEVRKGIYGRLKQGIYPFAAPIGYTNTGKANPKLVDPIFGQIIRDLFERYASNAVSLEELGEEFWLKGLRARSGGKMHPNRLSQILNNPFYIGIIRIGTTGEVFQGVHKPLISKSLFERVQRILQGKTVPKAKKHRFVLRQKVACGECGRRTLTGERQKGRTYYRCHNSNCPKVSWTEEALLKVVQDKIGTLRLSEGEMGDLGTMAKEEYERENGDRAHLKTSLELRLKQLDFRSDRLTDLLMDETIDNETYRARKEKLLLERQGLLEELSAIERASPLKSMVELFEQNNNKLLRYEMASDDEKREIMEIVGSNFIVRGKEAVFALQTPYAEIENTDDPARCGHHRGDLRTVRVFTILKSVAYQEVGECSEPHLHVPLSPGHPPGTGAPSQ